VDDLVEEVLVGVVGVALAVDDFDEVVPVGNGRLDI
jgi:hypothetical protein